MIKIFRNIRQNLLLKNLPDGEADGQAGKTRKPTLPAGRYFKYAIGEILLVVIGILIALQINNWNENRKLENRTQAYYRLLLEDLEKEEVKVNGYMDESNGIIGSYEAYEEAFNQSDMSYEDIRKSLAKINIGTPTPFLGINTIETLKSTGDIRLVSTEIRTKILELSRFQDYLDHILKRNRTNHVAQMSELGKLGWNKSMRRLRTNTNFKRSKKITFSEEDEVKFITAIESVYNQRYRTELIAYENFKKILNDIAEIKVLIKKKLKT